MRPVELELPKKFSNWRVGQEEILDKLAVSKKKFLILEGPTGSGKTLVGTAYHKTKHYKNTVYSCTTKKLQDQYMQDFYSISKDLKGRSNYPCLQPGLKDASLCLEGKDFDCEYVDYCPYRERVREVEWSEVAVLNTWSLLCQVNYAGRFTRDTGKKGQPARELLILDEADLLEDILIDFSGRSITKNLTRRNYLEEPDFSKTSVSYWKDWLETNIQILEENITNISEKEEKNRLLVTEGSLSYLWSNLDETWVVENLEGEVRILPTNISYLANKSLFKNYDKILLMSATFCGPEVYSKIMGIGKEEVDYFKLDSSIPSKRRPVYFLPVSKLVASEKEEALSKISDTIEIILDTFPSEQTIIHTVSESNAEYLKDRLNIDIYDSELNKDTLELFNKGDIRVLASPSLVRGYDFPDDKCRINIIMKVPYPYLGSKSVKRRMEINPEWYIWKTAQTIIQMSGRSTRSESDYSITFILDSKFRDVVARARSLLPSWWLSSWKIIDIRDLTPSLLEKAKE